MASTNLSGNFLLKENFSTKEKDLHQPESPFPLVSMNDFVKKDDSTRRKNSCPVARMGSYSQNCFLLIPIMVSTQWNSTDQKILLPLVNWRILKNRFPIYGKSASTLKNLWKIGKIAVQWQEYDSSLKNWFPRISIIVSTNRKKLGIKQ